MFTEIKGNIIDVKNQNTYPGIIKIEKGKITDIKKVEKEFENYILPGFIDAHVHIESSMLTPSEFARVATVP